MDQEGVGPATSDDFPQDADAQGPMPEDGSNVASPGGDGMTTFDPGMDTGPQDSFGPEDMGPMTDEGGTTFSPDSAYDDATEGTPPPRRKRRRAPAAELPPVDADEEGYDENEDASYVDDGAVDSTLYRSEQKPAGPWGIDGLGAFPAAPSLLTLGLVGVGAYLLFCKRK